MQIGPAFITYPQAAELVQPGDGAFDHPARHAEMAAMSGAALADLRADAALPQDIPVAFTVVGTIGLNDFRARQRMATPSRNGRHALQERQQLRRVVPVGAGQDDIQWRAVAVDEEVVLAARLAPISRVGTSFFPPCTARTDEESAITREKSRRSAWRNLASRMRCSLSQTPACCQSLARRQQLMPEPHPISLGSISHGRPDCRMNRMPVKTRRSSRRLRPAGDLRGGGGGSKGWTISHNASSTSSRAIVSLHRKIWKDPLTPIIRFC